MKQWVFDDVTVIQEEFDYDLKKYNVSQSIEGEEILINTLVPTDIDGQDVLIDK